MTADSCSNSSYIQLYYITTTAITITVFDFISFLTFSELIVVRLDPQGE